MMPDLPENRSYKFKRFLLGPPLVSERLKTERLGKPVALAVLSSDVMSSSAYATESMLRILLVAAGIGAYALVTPITIVILLVLAAVCLLYRQVVRAYPVSGGSYVVSRENFGYNVAQIPGAALLCSYTLTVAVSVAAGVDAIISAFPALSPYPVEMSIGFVLLLTYGNLRGVREAGRVFAVPTYWFLASMALLMIVGFTLLAFDGHLDHIMPGSGQVPTAPAGTGVLYGASLFLVLRGFANGSSAMTGMEAISNAVPVFKEPRVKNARTTLVLMATILGALFLGVSILAALTHAPVYESGTPTVLSQIGKEIFGSSTLGQVPYYSLQFSTALILVLGANTSYNGFPLLVSFIAEDAFLPRPLTTRGHRLVFSNGIIVLTAVSLLLLIGSGAKVANLIPLYACTVFTGFTMAGAGMARYHLRHPGPGRNRRLAVAIGAFVCQRGGDADLRDNGVHEGRLAGGRGHSGARGDVVVDPSPLPGRESRAGRRRRRSGQRSADAAAPRRGGPSRQFGPGHSPGHPVGAFIGRQRRGEGGALRARRREGGPAGQGVEPSGPRFRVFVRDGVPRPPSGPGFGGAGGRSGPGSTHRGSPGAPPSGLPRLGQPRPARQHGGPHRHCRQRHTSRQRHGGTFRRHRHGQAADAFESPIRPAVVEPDVGVGQRC